MRCRLLAASLAVAVTACSGGGSSATGSGADRPTEGATPASDGETIGTSRGAPAPTAAGQRTADGRPSPPADVEPFDDPTTLASALVQAELAIRDPSTSDADIAGWAWVQQQAYRDLVVNPTWRPIARTAMPVELQAAFDANVHAGEELRALTQPRGELPPWRIVEPPSADELREHYAAAEQEFGVGWEYLAAIHLVETRMGRIRGTSIAGARGPMQFMPATWEAYGEGDIDDPRDAIRAAARYLVDHGAPGDMRDALWAYNHSDRYVNAVAAYAGVMAQDERAYRGYHAWKVYYRLTTGDVVLDVGYEG